MAIVMAFAGLFVGAWKLVESGVASVTVAGAVLSAIVLAATDFLASRTRDNVPLPR